MENKSINKIYLIFLLVFSVLFISVAYATFNSELNISGDISIFTDTTAPTCGTWYLRDSSLTIQDAYDQNKFINPSTNTNWTNTNKKLFIECSDNMSGSFGCINVTEITDSNNNKRYFKEVKEYTTSIKTDSEVVTVTLQDAYLNSRTCTLPVGGSNPYIDKQGPTVTITQSAANKFTYSATDDMSSNVTLQYMVTTSSTTPSLNDSNWSSNISEVTIDNSAAHTYYVWAKDGVNITHQTISTYLLTKTQGTGTTLTLKYNNNSGATLSTGYVLNGTQVYAVATPSAGYNTAVLKKGSTTIATGTGTGNATSTQTISGATTISSSASANTYLVNYDANGGTGSMASQLMTYGTSTALSTNTFTKTGYTFAGWNTANDGTGANYTNGQSVSNLVTTNNGSITLYAKWTASTYTVTANSNGGSIASTTGWTGTGNTSTKSVTYDAAYGTLPTVTRTGYTLAGWSLLPEGYTQVEYIESTGTQYIDTGVSGNNNNLGIEVKYSFTSLPSSTSYAGIFGSFTGENYNATRLIQKGSNITYFNINSKGSGGTGSYNGERIVNTVYNESIYPVDSGFVYNTNNVSTRKDRTSGTENANNIAIFAQNTSGSIKSSIKLYDLKIYDNYVLIHDYIPCINNTTGKAGLYDIVNGTFYGNANASGDDFIAGNEVYITPETLVTTASNHNIYAKWAPNSYTIAYAMNNGNNPDPKPTTGNYNEDVVIGSTTMPTKAITVTGNANGTGATIGSATVSVQSFAGWTSNQAAGLNSEAKTGTTSNPSTAWDGSATTNKYFRNLGTAGGTVTLTATWSGAVNLPTATKEGYTCKWYSTNGTTGGTLIGNSGGTWTPDSTSLSAVTIYARCTPNSYTVTANANGGTIASTTGWTGTGNTSTKSVTYDAAYGTLPTVSRTGYTFQGWSLLPDGYTQVEYVHFNGEQTVDTGVSPSTYSGNYSIEMDEGHTTTSSMYIIWTSAENSNTNSRANIQLSSATAYAYANKEDNSGYLALTLNNAVDITGAINHIKYTVDSTNQSRTLTVNNNTESSTTPFISQSTATIKIGRPSTSPYIGDIYGVKIYGNGTLVRNLIPCVRTSDGKPGLYDTVNGTFYTNASGSNLTTGSASYINASDIVSLASNHNIYAKWTVNSYTITLNPNGGSYNETTSNTTITKDFGTAVNIGYPTRPGYTFTGWQTSTGNIYDRNLLKGYESPTITNTAGATYPLSGWRLATVSASVYNGRSVIPISDAPEEGITGGFEITGDGTTNRGLDLAQNNIPVTIGNTYTISVWAKGSGTLRLQVGNGSPYYSKTYTLSNVSTWTKYSFTFVAGTDGTATNNMTNVFFGNGNKTGTLQICGMKLEENNGFTDLLWSKVPSETTNPTLIAQWAANSYTVTADSNGGSIASTTGWTGTGSTSTKPVTYDATYGTLPTVSRTGYTFQGWNGKNLFNKETTQDGYEISGTNIVAKDGWFVSDFIEVEEGKTYTISGKTTGSVILYYDINKQNGTRDQNMISGTITIPNGKKYIKINGILTQKASVQIEEGTEATTYEPYYITDLTTVTQAKDHTITAIWTPNTYTIAYAMNNGSNPNPKPTSGTYNSDVAIGTTTMPTKTITITGNANSTGATIGSATATVQTFAGWTSNSGAGLGTGAKTGTSASPSTAWDGSATTNKYFKNLRDTSGTVTLTANWSGTVNLPTATKAGYVCKWYSTEGTTGGTLIGNSGGTWTPDSSSTAAVTVYARCTPNVVTVNVKNGTSASTKGYSLSLSTNSSSDTATYTATNSNGTATFSGVANGTYYIYSGKNSNALSTRLNTGKTVTVSNNSPSAVTVQYYELTLAIGTGITSVSNGGTATTNAVEYLYNSSSLQSISIDATVTNGYTWSTWTASGTTLNTYTAGTKSQNVKMGAGATTLTASAVYSSTPVITTTDHNTFSVSANSGSKYLISKTQTTKPEASASGWSTTSTKDVSTTAKETWYVWAKDANGNVSDNYATITNYVITLSAGTGTTLTAKANTSSGTTVTNGMYVLSGSTVYPTGALSTGYKTLVVQKNGSTITNSSGQIIEADTTFATSATPKTYTITLNKNDGTSAGTTSVTATYDSSAITPTTITLAGKSYTISGFTLLSSATGATVSSTSTLTSTATLKGYYTGTNNGYLILRANTTATYYDATSSTWLSDGKWVKDGGATLYAQFNAIPEKTLPTITKDGYICGWTTDNAGTTIEYQSGESLAPSSNTVLYGVCTPNTYKLVKVSNNILANPTFDDYTIVDAPTKTANGVTHTWDKELNGIPGNTNKAYSAASWGTGGNMGVAVPEIGYHAHIKLIDGNAVFDFKTNEAYDGKTGADVSGGTVTSGTVKANRWLGIAQTPAGSNFTAGHKYAITMDVYRVSGTTYVNAGLSHKISGADNKTFHSGTVNFVPTTTGEWETITRVFTLDENYLSTTNPTLYIYGYYGAPGELYIDNVSIEDVTESNKVYASNYTSTELASLTRTGYTFGGWTSGKNDTSLTTSDTFTTSTASFEDVATAGTRAYIYAKWTPNTYTITLNNQSATTAGTISIYEKYDNGYYLTNTSGTLSNKMNVIENSITKPTKTGYTFGGYYTGTNGTGTQYINANGYLTSNAISTQFSGSTNTLYAKWIDNTAPVIVTTTPSSDWDIANYVDFNATDGGSGIVGYNITSTSTAPTTWIPVVDANIVETTTETKYEKDAAWARVFHHNTHWGSVLFSGANDDAESKSSNTTDKYSVLGNIANYKNSTNWEFLLQYPDASASGFDRWTQTSNPVTTSNSVTGYTTIGTQTWTGNQGLSLSSTNEKTFIDGQVGGNWCYAIGAKTAYKGGIPGGCSPISTVNLWARIDNLTTATSSDLTRRIGDIKENGTYYVWVKDAAGNTGYATVTISNVDKTAPATATITSTNNVATSQTATLTMGDTVGVSRYYFGTSDPANVNVTYTSVTPATSVSKTSTVSNGGTYYLSVQDIAGNRKIASKAFYKTTLNANSGSVSPSSVITMDGNSFALPTPTRTGYTFAGWYTDSGLTTAVTLTSGNYKPTATATLYARWIPNELVFEDQTITNTFSTSAQTANVTAASNGTGTYTYSKVSGESDITVSSAGVITIPASKTVNTTGYTVVVRATDSNSGATKDATYKIKINKKKATITRTDASKALTYPTAGTNAYTYDGDGTLSCSSSSTTYVTCAVDTTNHVITVTPVKPTSSAVTITLSATAGTNYSAPDNKTFTVTVAKGTLTATATALNGTYSGSEQYAKIKVTKSNWDGKIIESGTSTSYGTTVTSNGSANTDYNLKPGYTNVTSSTTIYYKITGGTYYNDLTGSTTVAISQSPTTTTLANITKTYNGNNQAASGATAKLNSNDTSISGAAFTYKYYTNNLCNVGETTTAPKNAGTYYVKATLTGTTNYESSTSNCATYTMNSKKTTITYNYNNAYQISFANGEYAETGYYIDWDNDFTISGVWKYPTAAKRYLVIGNNSDGAKTLNIEATTENKFRIYMGNGGAAVDAVSSTTIGRNVDITYTYSWVASTHTYTFTATGSSTNISMTGTASTMAGVSARPLRYGTRDNTNSTSAFTTTTYHKTLNITKVYTANGTNTLDISSTVSKPAYTFNGWYTASTGGTAVSNETLVPATNTTYYAQWTPNTFQVKFNANGGSGTMANESFTFDQAKALTANAFVREGYTFVGWSNNSTTGATSGIYYDGQSVSNLSKTNNATVNLYALWRSNGYQVVYDGNGNTSGSMSNQNMTYGTAGTLTANGFTKTGYTFNNWKTSTSTTGVSYNNQASININPNMITGTSAPAALPTSSVTTGYAYSGRWARTSTSITPTIVNMTDTPSSLITKGFNIPNNTTSANYYMYVQYMLVDYNQPYTLSVYAKGSGTLILRAGNSTPYKEETFTLTDTWTRYSMKVIPVNSNTAGTYNARTSGRYLHNIGFGTPAGNGAIQVAGVKFEIGDTATEYTDSNNTLNLHAQWTPTTYTIAYAMNNGNNPDPKPTSGTYNSDVAIGTTTAPSKTVTITPNVNGSGASIGSAVISTQTFSGWSSSSSAGLGSGAKTGTSSNPSTAWAGATTTNKYFKNLRDTSGTVTLTANWSGSVTLPTVTKAGCTCKWYDTDGTSGGNIVGNSGGPYTIPYDSEPTVNIYARCTPNPLTFNDKTVESTYNETTDQKISSGVSAASNGSGTYTYAITGGNTNNYFSLDGRHIMVAAGTPANATGYQITITVTDSNTGATKAATYTIIVNKHDCVLTTSASPVTPGDTVDLSTRANNVKGELSYSFKSGGRQTTTTASTISETDNKTFTAGEMSATDDENQPVDLQITDTGDSNYKGCTKDLVLTVKKKTNTLASNNHTVYVNSENAYDDLIKNNNGGELTATLTSDSTTGGSLDTTNKIYTAGVLSSSNDNNGSAVFSVTSARTTTVAQKTVPCTLTVQKYTNTLAANNKTVYVNSSTVLTSLIKNNNGGELTVTKGTDNTSGSSISNGNFVAGELAVNSDANKTVALTYTSARTTTVKASGNINVTVTVQKYTNALSWTGSTPANNASLAYGTSYTATATPANNGGTNGAITYTSGTTATMTINSSTGAITVKKADGSSSVITASMAATTTVKAATLTRTFKTGKGTCAAPTNVAIATDKKVTWTASSSATSYQACVATGSNTCTPSTALTSGSAYNAITDETGTRTVYVRSVCDTTYYTSANSSNASASKAVYSVTLTKGTGISAVSGAGNYITGASASIDATVSSGYTWTNWTGSSTIATKSTSVTVNANKSYTANATANTYTIAYAMNNGTNPSPKPTSGTYNSNVSIGTTSIPTKTVTITGNANGTGATVGSATVNTQTFSGWSSSSEAGLGGNAQSGSTTSNFAAWSGTTTTNKYFKNLRNSSGTVTLTANWSGDVTLPTVTKEGYTCKWYDTEGTSGGSSLGNSGESIPISSGSTTSINVYARCTINSYTLTINPNGGSYNGTTSNTTVTQEYSSHYFDVGNNPTKAGYVFNGWTLSGAGGYDPWYTGSDYTAINDFSYNSSSSSLPSVYNNSGNNTVTRQMVSDSTANGGYSLKVTTNGTASPGAGGISVAGFSTTPGRINVVQVYAKIPTGYSLILNGIGEHYTGVGSEQVHNDTAGTGNWKYYNFVVYSGDTGNFQSNVYLYLSGSNNTSVSWNVSEIDVYSYTKNNFKSTYTFGAGNATLTANWQPGGAKVTFNINGGYFDSDIVKNWTNGFYNVTSTTADRYYYYNTAYQTRSGYDYAPAINESAWRDGYTFDGWYTSASGGTKVFNANGTLVSSVSGYSDSSGKWIKYNSNVTLYAHWNPNTITITLNNQGGCYVSGTTTIYEKYDDGFYLVNTSGTLSQKMTSSVYPITRPRKIGYSFGGYYTQANGGGTQIINENGYIASSANLSMIGRLTYDLYAKWTAETYYVDAFGNGGTLSSATTGWSRFDNGAYATRTVAFDSTFQTVPTPTRSGYTFDGWYNNSDQSLSWSAGTGTHSYKRLAQNLVPGATYTVKIGSATRTAGSATQFTVTVYDHTTSTGASSTTQTFGSNKQFNVSVPTNWNNGDDISIIIYAGLAGSTNGNTVNYSNIRVSSSNLNGGPYTGSSVNKIPGTNYIYAHWK